MRRLKRKRSESVKKRDLKILEVIIVLKQEHPYWGYRRIWSYMKYRLKITCGKNRVYRVMTENKLLVSQIIKKAPRKSTRPKLKATKPNNVWGIDMTKIMISEMGWAYLVIVLDWYSKKIVGYSLAMQSKSRDWLDALDMGIVNQFPNGVKGKDLKLVSDHGSQPTSTKFIEECGIMEIKQIFASYNNPKGNADTERVIRTLKEDLVWPREWETFPQLEDALSSWIKNYNNDYPHSTLGYMTPCEFEKNYMADSTFLVA
ncbi:IS3 family transposase [bacterium]|nr:IS3 family transposase [bacterium]